MSGILLNVTAPYKADCGDTERILFLASPCPSAANSWCF
jgi:hypothetical protein